VSSEAPPPVLSESQRRIGADVLVSFTVRSDGTVADVKVESASDDDIGRRCKAAVESWKYRPATADDGRSVDVRIEAHFKVPPSGS
jgi:TonB family protein